MLLKGELTLQDRKPVLSRLPLIPVKIYSVPWLFPTWARAQTWWNVVLVRKGVGFTQQLLAHELAHLLQWRCLGVFGFVCQCALDLVRHGYEGNPLEIAARLAEQNDFFLSWTQEILKAREKTKVAGGHAFGNAEMRPIRRDGVELQRADRQH